MTFSYKRHGQPYQISDAVGTRTFSYDTHLARSLEAFGGGSLYGTRGIKTVYDDTVGYTPPGGMPQIFHFMRLAEIGVGTSSPYTGDYQAKYDYDGDTDRLSSVNPGPGLPGGGAAGSNLVTQVNYKSGSSTTIAQTLRGFDAARGLIESVQNDWSGPSPTAYMASKYAYVNDALARRTSCVRTGAAFDGNDGRSPEHHDVWAYNDRSELTGGTRRLGTTVGSGDAVPGDDRGYEYDPIGNRTESTKGEDDPIYYCANELNQYEHTAATSQPCSTQPVDVFEHDDDGNLIEAPNGDGSIAPGRQVRYEWDAENRLIRAAPASSPASGDKKVEYTYDYMNRRVERKVFDWDPEAGENGDWATTPSEHTRYVYHGWNVILELNALDSNAILKKYTWGLDLAGQNGGQGNVAQPPSAVTAPLQGAGGIGGLLACLDTAGTPSTGDDRTFAYCYDANGNVTQLVETSTSSGYSSNYGTLQAAYEYDAYGNTLVASFGYADSNLIRFSTRPIDPLTLLGHWPMRVLDFERGRWGSRDPGAHRHDALPEWDPAKCRDYICMENAAVNMLDPDGQLAMRSPKGPSGDPLIPLLPRLLPPFGPPTQNPECCEYCEVELATRVVLRQITGDTPLTDAPTHRTDLHFSARVSKVNCKCPRPGGTGFLNVPVVITFGPVGNSPDLPRLGGTDSPLTGADQITNPVRIPCCIADCLIANQHRMYVARYNPLGPNSTSALEDVFYDCGLPLDVRGATSERAPMGAGVDPGPSTHDHEDYVRHCYGR